MLGIDTCSSNTVTTDREHERAEVCRESDRDRRKRRELGVKKSG